MFVRPPLLNIRRALIVSYSGPNEWLWSKRYRANFDLLTPGLRSLKYSLYLCYNDLPVDGSMYVNVLICTVLFFLFMFHVNVLPTAAVLLYFDPHYISQHTLGLLSSFKWFFVLLLLTIPK